MTKAKEFLGNDWSFMILLVFFSGLYVFNASNQPALGDDLSFTLAAMQGFDWATNATNHFLYLNTLHLLHLLLPFIDPHRLFLWLSLIPGILVLAGLYKILVHLKVGARSRFMAVMALGFSFTFWRHNEIVEVYTLNLALNTLLLWLFVKWTSSRKEQLVLWAGFLLGISMLVHIQNILLLPFLMYWSVRAHKLISLGNVVVFMCFLAPTLLLFILPLITHSNSFSNVLFDSSFKDEVLDFDLMMVIKGGGKSMAYLFFNFGAFALLMILSLFRNPLTKELKWGLLLLIVPVFGFAMKYNVSDNYVFFLPAYLGLIIMAAASLDRLLLNKPKFQWLLLMCVLAMPIGYYVGPSLALKTRAGVELNSEKSYKGGVGFFIWPGMRTNPGAIDLAKQLKSGSLEATHNLEIEQNAHKALNYLQLMEPEEH